MGMTTARRRKRMQAGLAGWAVLALATISGAAWGKDGIQADLTILTFQYQVINPNAGEGEVIGRISVADGDLSVLDALKMDLGGDGAFGGGDDVPLDLAEIDDSGQFDVLLSGDVVKLSGNNNYELVGGISVTDTLSTLADPSIGGRLTSSSISLAGRVFSIIGTVGPFVGGDSLLLPPPADSWVFTGLASDTGNMPNEDGVVGTITVPTGRTLYTAGNFVEFHFAFDGNVTLDEYFKQDRSASSADIKLVIPRGDEPPVIGACCLPDGSCAQVTRDECEDAGGTYKGDNVPCDNHTCAQTGACCLPDGSCAEMFQDDCEAAGGTYKGDSVPCDNHTCAQTGACCLPDGSCAEMFRDDCEAAGGTYKGDNVPCDNHTCAQTGACCLPDGSCAEMFRDDCEAAGGTYKGDNVPCDNHTCAQTGACCLPDGSCAEMFQDDCEAAGGTYHGDGVECSEDLCVQDCVITCPPDVSVCAGCGECSVHDIDLGEPTVEGDCDGVVITNDAPAEFPIGTTIVTWTATVGDRRTQCEQRVTVKGTICGAKFYDENVNGVHDRYEPGINGWRIELRDESGENLLEKVYTKREGDDDGRYSFCVEPGTYTVLEVMPNDDWIATTPTSYTVTVGDGSCDLVREFGNVCLGDGGGHTPGFWGNKNGETKMKDGGSANPELAMLRGLNLRNASGSHFDPNSYDPFKNWLRAGDATNMAYMLSIHLAAMALNVEAGYVRGDAVVYAPGCGNRGPGNSFITISDLMAAADRAPGDGLGDDGYTPSGDPHRAAQECRKNALDAANNNDSFVRSEPCCFHSPY